MTNRHRAGILCVPVLTLLLSVPAVVANEVPIGKKVPKVEKVAKPASVEQAPADEVPDPADEIDLERDLTNKLVRPDGMEFKPYQLAENRKIEYFLVYFGAHWCPKSKKFTPKLTDFYREQRLSHQNFEVIFVSSDKDEEAMLQYMNGYKMPWPAVKFGANKELASLRALARRGYPCVALVDAEGELLAHSYGADRKGDYVGPLKPVEKLEEILGAEKPKAGSKSVAQADR